MHALITGPRGVGKSTLIRRVVEELGLPVFGFETKKEDGLADPEQGSPVYIYDAGAPHVRTPDNLVGYCGNKCPAAMKRTFDRYAPKLRAPIPDGHVVLMDEIGFMEASSRDFCAAVLSLLDGSVPVIAAVKAKDTKFLNTVRAHPNAVCFSVTEDNRESLYHEVLAFLRAQLGKERPSWQEKP